MSESFSSRGQFSDFNSNVNSEIESRCRQSYQKPQLKKHGTIQGITLGSSGDVSESPNMCFDIPGGCTFG